MTEALPELRGLPDGLVLDGELVAFNKGWSYEAKGAKVSERRSFGQAAVVFHRSGTSCGQHTTSAAHRGAAVKTSTIPRVLDWLEQVQQRLQQDIDGAGVLELSPADIELLLELARRAAHESGDRTNAPLVSYLVGLAHGRSGETGLEKIVTTALGNVRADDAEQ